MADLIRDLVAPEFNKQVLQAKADLHQLNDEVIDTFKSILQLRNATANSTTFSDLTKNTNAFAKAQVEVITNADKQAAAAAKVQAAEEKRMNAYLIALSREQAAREAAQAKEDSANQKRLAAIDVETAKLQEAAAKRARLNEDDERFHRPSYREDPMFEIGPSTPATGGNGTAIPDEGASQNAQSATLANIGETTGALNQNTAAKTSNTQATEESNAALLSNINFNNELKVELALVNEQIKESATFDAELTAQQLRLTQAIRDNNAVISQQIKLDNAASGSNNEQRAQLEVLRAEYNALTTAEKANAEVGGVKLAQIQKLAPAVSASAKELGKYGDNVGNYPETAIDKVIGRFNSLDKVGARVLQNVTRHVISFGTSFLVFGLATKAFELLSEYLATLDIFKDKLTEAEMKQKAFTDAFKGSEYASALKATYELGENIKLATDGFLDKDKVVDQYNESIGKVTGRIDTLNEAEAGLTKNAAAYIAATLQKAAANIVLADAAKDAAETAAKNEEIQDTIDKNRKTAKFMGWSEADIKVSEDRYKAQIAENNKTFEDAQKKRMSIIQQLGKTLNSNGGGGLDVNGSGVSAQSKIETDIANQKYEAQKRNAEAILNNDKLSYKARIDASYEYEDAVKKIANNNEALALNDSKLSKDQKLKLENDYQNGRIAAENAGNKQRQDLINQHNKDVLMLLEQDIEDQKAVDKKIFDDKSKSASNRIAALNDFQKKSISLIKIAANEEVTTVGDNAEKIKLIRLKEKDAILGIQTETTTKLNEITKDQIDKNIKALDDRDKKRITSLRSSQQSELEQINTYEQQALVIASQAYAKGEITKAEYEQQKLDITISATKDSIETQIKGIQAVIDYEADNLIDTTADEKALSELKIKLAKDTADAQIKAAEQVGEAEKYLKDLRKQSADEAVTLISTIVNNAYKKQEQAITDQSNAVDAATQSQIDAENRSLDNSSTKADKIALINAQATAKKQQLANEEKKIEQEAAEFNKLVNIAKAGEALALAEVQALSYLSNPITAFAYPEIAAFIGAIGLAQIATLIATPAYKHGTDNHPGGPMIVGDGYKPELIIDPNGTYSLSPDKPTLMNGKRGTRVIDGDLTTKILTRPEQVKYVGGEQISMREVERLLKKVAVNTEHRTQRSPTNKYPAHWNTDYFRSKIN